MKAILDHVGIAVRNVAEALTFYRDALGLEIEASEDVASQKVRAHFIPTGESTLELLEGTATDSAISRYIEKRGPGLHHITLRVDDLAASLDRLKARGVRLIDERPRPGAEHAMVAFIHPSSAHGVLVELKQASSSLPELRISRYTIGDLELTSLYDGFFRLDGGSMFGIVPKALWSRKTRPDNRNRILLGMRPLLVRGVRTMLIDAGIGDKEGERFRDLYGVDRSRALDQALSEAGVTPDQIDIVLLTHLHFDHAGGLTIRDASGRIRPKFPRARCVVRRGEWDDASHTHARNRGNYLPDNFLPLADAGVLELVSDDQTIMPGVRVQRTGGHTREHQMIWIESGGKRAVYVGDIMPTSAHLDDPWIMAIDLYPVETLTVKQAVVRQALERETLIFLPHDPATAAGYLTESNGKRTLRSAP